ADTAAFSTSIGFVHASDKSFRLAAAAAYLRAQDRKLMRSCSPQHFFAAAGCLQHLQSKPSSPSRATIPCFHLPVSSVLPCGIRTTYDIRVSRTHSFLATKPCIHNCKI